MQSFDFQHRTRIVFGSGKIRELGKLAVELGCKRAMIVSDPGVVRAGHFAKGLSSIQESGLAVISFHELGENPSTKDVDKGLAVAREFSPDLLIGLGGGSSMDCAKGINFLYSCGGAIRDYWGVGKATADLLPMIAVPTTAGTGSEAQSFALITDAETKQKMACGDPRAACRIALLDPELTLTQPPRVAALTGLDAISHALETFVTKRRSELSSGYSRQAWRLLSGGFQGILQDGSDIEARSMMQLGAYFAGLAIETSMLGAAHSLANPLTSHFGTVHGQAVTLMLPHVIQFNQAVVPALYEQIWTETSPVAVPTKAIEGDASRKLAGLVTQFTELAGLCTSLSQLKIGPEAIDSLAQDAVKQWTAHFNPRELTLDDAKALYAAAL
jgi:alcohol dehydrogenase